MNCAHATSLRDVIAPGTPPARIIRLFQPVLDRTGKSSHPAYWPDVVRAVLEPTRWGVASDASARGATLHHLSPRRPTPRHRRNAQVASTTTRLTVCPPNLVDS